MAEDNDKTIRTDSQNISSGVGADDKTVREDAKVIGSGFDSDATVRIDKSVISAQPKTHKESHIIGAGVEAKVPSAIDEINEFNLNGKVYKRIKTISETTGEAQIYLVESEKTQAVLKLYYPSIKPKEALVAKLREIQHKSILQILDFGYSGNRFFELLEYAAGGTLDKYVPVKDIEHIKNIVESTAEALNFCHLNHIVHRDIKPGNIFYKDVKRTGILIGDFGISSLLDEEVSMQITGQARSALYAAPELYQSIGGQTVVSKELDYYALGITLIFIWRGENPFKGIDELSLMYIKNEGKIPIPDDIPDELLKLIKGLTVVSREKRWGYNEITRWLNGEEVEVHEELYETDYKKFYYSETAVANNPAELADLLVKDPELGKKYLYRGKITKWLEEGKNQKLALELEEIYEKLYPKDMDAGLQASIYLLDSAQPYIAVDGTACSSLADFANVFDVNFDAYKKQLKNKNDNFYLYLASKGEKRFGDKLRSFFKDLSDEVALQKIIYNLDPTSDFRFEFGTGKKKNVEYYADVTNIAHAFLDYNEDAKEALFNGSLIAWLEAVLTDETLEESLLENYKYYLSWAKYVVENYEDDQDAAVQLLCYIFDSELPYIAEDGTECRTKDELASVLISNGGSYVDKLMNQNDSFYLYLMSKDWDDDAEFARQCFDHTQHTEKIAPYNATIALLKVVYKLGGSINYISGDLTFEKIEDLLSYNKKAKNTVIEDLEDPYSVLFAWLSIQFHEENDLDLSVEGAYEEKFLEMVNFIEKINKNHWAVKRFKEARDIIPKKIKKQKSLDGRFLIGKILAYLLPVLSGGLLVLYVFSMKENPLPGAFWNVSFTYYLVCMILFTIFYFFSGAEEGVSTGCIGGPIVGAIGGVLLYYAIYFIISIPWLLAAIVALVLVFTYKTMITAEYTNKDMKKQLFDMNDKATFFYEPLAYAFNKEQTTFESQRLDLLEQYHSQRKYSKKVYFFNGFLPAVVLLACLFLLASFDAKYKPYFDKIGAYVGQISEIFESEPAFPQLVGEWSGTYARNEMTLAINTQKDSTFTGQMNIALRQPITAAVTGFVDTSSNKILFTDNEEGSFEGTLNMEERTITGVHTNKAGRKNNVVLKLPLPVIEDENKDGSFFLNNDNNLKQLSKNINHKNLIINKKIHLLS